jgi:ketosteroid isomerase-like protein
MGSPVPRAVVEAFYHALSVRDMDALESFLDDQVVWTISGPVDIPPFCGRRVGKDVVIKLIARDIPTFYQAGASFQNNAGRRRAGCGACQADRDQTR